MALADLLAALEADARAEAVATVERAREEALALRRRAARRLRAARARVREEAAARARAEARDALVSARRDAVERGLRSREAVVEQVMDAARRGLPGRLEDVRVAPGLAAELVRDLEPLDPSAEAVVTAEPALVDALAAAAEGRPCRVEADPGVGSGFVLRAPGRGLTVEATLEAALEALRPRLAVAVARALAAPPEAGP